MKALVLAAGEGSRLGGLTRRKPKALLRIAGMVMLRRILHGLKEAGVQDVWIVVGYKADMIRGEIGESYADLNIQFVEAKHWKKGNLYSLLAAEEIFQQNFLLCMCDHIFDPGIPRSLSNNKVEKAVVLAVERVSEQDTKILEQNGKIVDIGKKISQSNVAIDTGFFLCSPKIFDYANEAAQHGAKEVADCVRAAARNGDTHIVDVSGHLWADIDTKQDLDRAKRLIVEDSQKKRGPSDFVAHYFNRPIENAILYHISDWLFITPNRLTIATNVLAWLVTYLFFSGHLLIGSILTFVVGIIDGLDGKLARIRKQQTRLGRMEHPFDMLYEFSWLVALALFSSRTQGLLPLELCMLSLMFIAFYRFCYDQFSRTMKVSLDIYGPFEQKFRRVAGRRNIYSIYIFFGVIFDVLLYSLFAILFHSALTAIVYAYRASIHLHAADREGARL
ncbi:MAG: NTP transferase domain-containing protein [Candidatus Bathyarchaeota archaeon]|nr:NTP transferase domain-containing protein [Candidatus Bathyarchaeota archaeon]MCZ2808955.1 NTP transferase domain-containing protein [Candidatus Bathyarchaeota archaeon]